MGKGLEAGIADMDASRRSDDQSARSTRMAASRMSAWLVGAVATMLDVEPSRLRAEISAIRPTSRLALAGLLASIGCTMIATLLAIFYVTSASEIVAAPIVNPASPVRVASRESHDAIVMRPLFWRSRQPATAPALVAIPETIASDPQISLKGVLISGDLAKAFFLSAETPAGVWRQRGEDVAGWRVAEILRDRVVLESGAGRFVVPMSYSSSR